MWFREGGALGSSIGQPPLLCSPDWSRFHTTLRCTESIHFLWPLNRKFPGLLVRSWISSAVADATVFAWLSWPEFECVQSTSGPRRCLHNRSVGPLLTLPEVHNQLFSFAHVQRETVVLAPWYKSLYLIQVCSLIIVGNEVQNHSIVRKFNNRSGAVKWHTVVCVERVEQGTQDKTLWGSYFQVWPKRSTELKFRKSIFVLV